MIYPYTSKRVGATIVDYALIFFLSWAYIFLLGDRQDGGYVVEGWSALGPVGVWFIYFVLAERFAGGTLGHQLFKIKVVSMDGNGLSFVQVVVRRIFDVVEISWCFGLIAWLLVRSTDRHQRIGDLLAKTLVVGAKDSYPYMEVRFDFDKK